MEITIDPVKNNELQVLTEVARKTFYDTFYQHNSPEDMELFLNKRFNDAVLGSQLSSPDKYFFFARANDEIVGYITLSNGERPEEIKDKQALEIARLYAVKEKIGLGVGKALMEFAISYAREHEKEVIWLGVWEHNLHAIRFYRKFGFEKFGEHEFVLGNDVQNDWLMKKELR